jgi:hypothetical protein
MLHKIFPQQLPESDKTPPLNAGTKIEAIPDPWEENSLEVTRTLMSDVGQLQQNIHPLISCVTKPEILKLSPPKVTKELSPAQVLLQDGLKVKAYDGGPLKEHLETALGLLSWMRIVTLDFA